MQCVRSKKGTFVVVHNYGKDVFRDLVKLHTALGYFIVAPFENVYILVYNKRMSKGALRAIACIIKVYKQKWKNCGTK